MESIVNLITANYEWVFSGIGVFVLGFFLIWLRRRRQKSKRISSDEIATKGKYSPGKVGGNFTVNVYESPQQEERKRFLRMGLLVYLITFNISEGILFITTLLNAFNNF